MGSYDPDGVIRSTRIDFGDGYVTTYATASHTYTLPGTFTVKASLTDDKGNVATKSATVTVYAGVKILSPTGSSVGPKFWVSATGFSSKPIVSTVIYLDGVQVYQASSYRVDTYVKAKPGSHTLMVKSWNSEGTTYKATKTITVQ
jgi:PKD repeat protein